MAEEDQFTDEEATQVGKLSADTSSASMSSHLMGDLFGTTDEESSDSQTHRGSGSTTKVSQMKYRSSNLKFASLNFMFPSDRRDRRESRLVPQKLGSNNKKKQRKKVRIAELAKFQVYNSNFLPFGDDENQWLDHCVVYLLSGHNFRSFEESFQHVSAKIYSYPDNALRYWREVLVIGCPVMKALEDADTDLNHISLVYPRRIPGVLPLPDYISLEDLKEPGNTDLARAKEYPSFSVSSSTGEYEADAIADGFSLDDLDEEDLTLGLLETQKSSKTIISGDKDLYSGNIYKTMCELDENERQKRKSSDDMVGLVRHMSVFGVRFKKMCAKDMALEDISTREENDRKMFQSLSSMLPPGEDKDMFMDHMYLSLAARYITMKLRIQAAGEMRISKHFRKAFACPTLHPGSKSYKADLDRALQHIGGMFHVLNKQTELFQHMDDNIAKKGAARKSLSKGISVQLERQMFGKIVIQKEKGDVCTDLFSGTEFSIAGDLDNFSTWKLTPRRLGGSMRILKKNKKKAKKKKGAEDEKGDGQSKVPEVLGAPDAVLPPYAAQVGEFFREPMSAWSYLKTKWMEIYVSQINSGVVTAMINGNTELYKWLENMSIPKTIEETSLLAAESFYNTGRARSKEAQRTTHVMNVSRTTRNKYVRPYHWKFSYIAKDRARENLLTSNKPADVFVDAMSLVLNAAVRADLYMSRKRHTCDGWCTGHRGMLLATLIRLGELKMARTLMRKGVRLDSSMCTGDAKLLTWDLSFEQKQDLALKKMKAAEEKKKKSEDNLKRLNPLTLLRKSERFPKQKEKESEVALDEDVTKESKIGDEIIADEVAIKTNMGNSSEVDKNMEDSKRKNEEVNRIHRLKSVKDVVMGTEDKKAQKQRQKADLKERDETNVLSNRRNNLVSTFYRQTPLAIAVQCAVADIYVKQYAKKATDVDRMSKLEKKTLAEFDMVEINMIEQRVEMVRQLIDAGAKVLACDGAALRACLPVVTNLAKAVKKKNLKVVRQHQQKLANVSHINNMSMMPRDLKHMRRQSKVTRFLPRASVTDKFSSRKAPKMTSSQLIDYDKFEKQAFKQYRTASSKTDTNKTKRYAAALGGLKVIKMVSEAAIEEITTTRKHAARKFKGKYPAMVVRIMLVHESIMQESWDTVRFLCPYQINIEKTAEMKTRYRDADMYGTSWKEFDPFTGEILKKVVRLLLLDREHPHATSNAKALNGIYFIMKEYNVRLSKGMMFDLVHSLMDTFNQCISLKPADREAIQKIMRLRQVQHFLELSTIDCYEERVLDRYALTTESHTAKILTSLQVKYNLSNIREFFLKAALGEGLTAVVDVFRPEFLKHGKAKRAAKGVAMYTLVKKQQPMMINSMLNLFSDAGLSGDFQKKLLKDVLVVCMSDGKSSRAKSAEADVVYQLLEYGITPDVSSCHRFLVRSLISPLLDVEHNYNGQDRCVDLSRYFVLQKIVSDIFYNEEVEPKQALQLFSDIMQKISKCISEGAVWLQGVDYLFTVGNTLFAQEIQSLMKQPNSVEAKVFETVNETMKFRMWYDKQREMLVMSPIQEESDDATQYQEIIHDADIMLDESDGKTISPLL